ncbi:MqnA/MqnD/SBP family protein [Nitratifractor sp.]
MFIFGSIDYLNLLPFQVYLKRRIGASQFQQMRRWQRGVPSEVNRRFRRRQVHAAFISSIESRRCRCSDLGIVARGAVHSVLLIEGDASADPASASSNRLARVLGVEGRVLIGDAALRYRLAGGEALDLAELWQKRTGLPFVFARLCANRHGKKIRKLAAEFSSKEWKIPQHLLRKAAASRDITPEELRWYLQHIDYGIGWKERKALKLFLKKARKLESREPKA